MSTFPLFSRFRSPAFVFSSAVVLSLTALAPTQGQTPLFNDAEYAESAGYNAKTDAAAVAVAAGVARRSAATPAFNAERSTATPRRVQNAPATQNAQKKQNASTFSTLTSRRSADAAAPTNVRPNAASQSQAARIWEAFLFGTPNRPVSKPKFAFAQRDAAPSPARLSSSPSRLPQTAQSAQFAQTTATAQTAQSAQFAQTTATAQTAQSAQNAQTTATAQTAQSAQFAQTTATAQNAQPLQSLQTSPSSAPTTDAEIAAARRRRLQELNALLATRRPEEFSRRLALKTAPSALSEPTVATVAAENNDFSEYADAPALPPALLAAAPTAKLTAERPAASFEARAEFVRESTDAPFDAARANRSKIRQASNFEPVEPLELADDGLATFLLPTRPNALRLSPNVFLSTDLVRLPSAAPLNEIAENSPSAQPTQSAAPSQTTQNAQTAQPLQSAQTAQPLQSAQAAQPLQSAETPAAVATPLPAAPSTDVPTLRPTAQFVEPRFLPSRR